MISGSGWGRRESAGAEYLIDGEDEDAEHEVAFAALSIRVPRNRIAHHEPMLSWNLAKHYENIVLLTEWLSPPAASWCRTYSRFLIVHPAGRIALSEVAIATTPENG